MCCTTLPSLQNEMYFICFQEMVDLNATNVMVDSGAAKRGQVWEELIESTLNAKEEGKYKLLISRHLVGILLCVYARKDIAPFVQDIYGNTAATGILGVMGNKGGAAARFKFYDSTICFVAAHLAAHRGNVAGRNSDFHTIVEKMVFQGDDGSGPPDGGSTIMDHDFVIWAGDLNYRIRSDVPDETVFEKCDAGDISWLAERDQLNITRAQGLAFKEFHEAPLTFFPTYKYQAGTHSYDRRPEKKVRSPAWCDRVLWRTSGNSDAKHIKLEHYGRSELSASDHKPVQAVFTLQVKKTIQAKKKAIYQDIMRRLDSWENTNIPKCALNIQGVEFVDAKYLIPQSKTITIENQGTGTSLPLFLSLYHHYVLMIVL
jgi:phosphatidylinositol-bisphosphatase